MGPYLARIIIIIILEATAHQMGLSVHNLWLHKLGPKPKPFHYMDQVTSLCHRLVAQTNYKIFLTRG